MKIWLCKHPIAQHYKESQSEAKRLAMGNGAKIIDVRQSDVIDPKLCEEPKLTPLEADKPKPKPKRKAEVKKSEEAPGTGSEQDS